MEEDETAKKIERKMQEENQENIVFLETKRRWCFKKERIILKGAKCYRWSNKMRTDQIPLDLAPWRFLVTSGRLTSEIKVKSKCRDTFCPIQNVTIAFKH